MQRRFLIALALLLPLSLLPALLARVADRTARSSARALDGIARALYGTTAAAEPRWTYLEPVDGPAEAELPPAKKVQPRSAALRGIRVGEAAVLRLANAGLRPTGIPVAAHGARPAGLALINVGGLGIGLRDGDVLVQAAGRPTLSQGDVVGVVLGSRAHRASEISGRFFRDGEAWNLVVEQPYLRNRREAGPVALASSP